MTEKHRRPGDEPVTGLLRHTDKQLEEECGSPSLYLDLGAWFGLGGPLGEHDVSPTLCRRPWLWAAAARPLPRMARAAVHPASLLGGEGSGIALSSGDTTWGLPLGQ